MPAFVVLLLLGALALGGEPAPLLDLDLAAPDGRPPAGTAALACDGVTWTADGLFLPAAAIPRIPREFPLNGERFPAPRAPYRVDLALPAGTGRSLTITLAVCLATAVSDQDNLFGIGPRSRWLTAQVGKDGRLLAGLDNRWTLLGSDRLPPLADRRWHALSVGLDSDRRVRLAADGIVVDRYPDREPSRFPPRPIPDDAAVLSFADPGSARHLHGLVRRIIVHAGLLDEDRIVALHRGLAGFAPPAAAAFAKAGPPGPAVEPDDPAPAGGNNF